MFRCCTRRALALGVVLVLLLLLNLQHTANTVAFWSNRLSQSLCCDDFVDYLLGIGIAYSTHRISLAAGGMER